MQGIPGTGGGNEPPLQPAFNECPVAVYVDIETPIHSGTRRCLRSPYPRYDSLRRFVSRAPRHPSFFNLSLRRDTGGRRAVLLFRQGLEPGGDAGGQTSRFHPDYRQVAAARGRGEAGKIRHPEEPCPLMTPAPKLSPGPGRKVRRSEQPGELAGAAHRGQAHHRVPGLAADADQAGYGRSSRLVEKLPLTAGGTAGFRGRIGLLISF